MTFGIDWKFVIGNWKLNYMFIDIVHASSEAAAEVAAETADGGVLASLGINAPLFIFQLINFAIVAVIIWFLILKPLTKKMAERQKMIDESITGAKRIQENLLKSEREYQARIDTAKVESNKIIEKTKAEADTLSESLKVKAKKEIELLVDQARRNINIEKEKMTADLKKEAADLVVMALEKILDEKITAEKDKKIISETLKNCPAARRDPAVAGKDKNI